MSEPVSVRARLEALRDSIFFSGWWGNKLAGEVESMEQAYSIERANCDPADFLVPTTDQTGRTLAEPFDESGLCHTRRIFRERCVKHVLELRKAIDSAFNAVRQAADLVNDPNAAPEQRWSAQIVRELQTLRGAILLGHDPTCQPSALPMIRAGVPEALRQAVAPLEPRFDRVKSLMLELCGDASEPGEESNPTGPADSPAARSESGSQSSLGRPARRETATIPTRAGSDDRVVPTGGGVPTAPSYLGDVRDFVAKGEACVAEAERWRQEDGHFVSPGLDRRWRAPFESIQKLYAQKIAPLCAYPWESLKVREFPGWVREHHADGEDRIMLNEDCGHVVARLATEQAGHDTVRVPIVRVGDAKALLLRLRAWLARFEQRDSGGGAMSPAAEGVEAPAVEPKDAPGVAGIGGTDTDWKEIQGRLLAKREQSEKYTSVRRLAAELACSDATIRKAIDKSDTLKEWRARSAAPTAAPRATDLGAVVRDNTPQTKEPAPDDVLTDDDVDAVMARLIDQAKPDERAMLNAMNDAERRELVATCQAQNLDDEPSPLEPDKPGERSRLVRQHKLA